MHYSLHDVASSFCNHEHQPTGSNCSGTAGTEHPTVNAFFTSSGLEVSNNGDRSWLISRWLSPELSCSISDDLFWLFSFWTSLSSFSITFFKYQRLLRYLPK